jgi:PAS domain S-box-containing protein
VDSNPDAAIDRLTHLAAGILRIPVMILSTGDANGQLIRNLRGIDEVEASAIALPLSAFCRQVVAGGQPRIVNDARNDPAAGGTEVLRAGGLVAYAGVPVRDSAGDVLGCLIAMDRHARTWSEHDVTVLSNLAACVASEIQLRLEIERHAETARMFENMIEGHERTEAELRESRRVLTTLIGNLPGMAYRCRNDESWTVDVVSEGVVALTGYRPEDLMGNRVVAYADLIHPDDRDWVWSRTQAALEARSAFGYVYRIHHRDGSVRWVQEKGRGVYSDAGELLALEGFIADVTEQRIAEAALRESEERYRILLRHYPEGVVILFDHELRLLVADGQALVDSGIDPQSLVGRTLQELVSPDRVGELESHYRAALSGDERAFVLAHEDRRFECLTVPVRNAAGEVIAGMHISHDVTKQTLADAERARLEEQLRHSQKMDAIGRLAGGVAHDFNNLLTVIKASADFLSEDFTRDDPRHQDSEQIRSAADRAAGLTRQLLAFSRKQILNPRPLALDDVVMGMKPMLSRLIGEDLHIITSLESDPALVMADPGQMEQVLMNLVLNARDAMPHGGIVTIVTSRMQHEHEVVPSGTSRKSQEVQAGEYVLLEVADTGHGIAPEFQERIFEPFFSTKDAGRGTGLGLATVYGIVRQSGGHIAVQSEIGKGSTFRVFLPRTAEGAVAADVTTTELPPPRGSETIMLVEDEEALRALCVRILSRNGYHVLQARSGADALRVMEGYTATIHLVVTDVVMPELGGRELAAVLQAERPGLPILYMSGYTDDEVLRRGVLVSETAFLQKPFSASELLRSVRSLLDSRPP